MIHNNQCEICREPTKRPVGFWDGYTKDGKSTGGYLYTCGNMECHIRQEEAKRELEEKQRTERALNENRRNNVDIHRMKRIRRLVGMTIDQRPHKEQLLAKIIKSTIQALCKHGTRMILTLTQHGKSTTKGEVVSKSIFL